MTGPALTRAEARRTVAAVDRAGGNVAAAARALGLARSTIDNRLRSAKANHGLAPSRSSRPKADSATQQDPVAARAARDAASRLAAEHAELARRLAREEKLREAVFGLAAEPLRPPSFAPPAARDGRVAEALVLPISDIHMGETIDLAEMGGRNRYDRGIARKRIERYFGQVVKLGTTHWSGPPPGVIYAVLLGDLVSGEIHEELAKTNDLLAMPAVRDLSECLVAGFDLLLKSFACDLRVVALPGNHGRATKKPEAKGNALNSYDTLAAWCVESWYRARGEGRISFSAPASGDALIAIHGWNILFTHGDRIGSRGGAGFVGPAATAARGMQRLIQDYAGEGHVVDACVIGHFHAPMELEQGFVNGSFGGPSEYSRSARLRSHPAAQWMLSVHPRRGPFARRWKVQVGAENEGSIYRGRAG